LSRGVNIHPAPRGQSSGSIDTAFTQDVAEVKQQDGGAISIHGSAELARRLGEAGLFDRYHLRVFPFVLGSGESSPLEVRERQSLRLLASDTYSNGVIKVVYEVSRH